MKLGISGVIGLAALLMAGCNNSTVAAFEKAAAELPVAEAAAKKLGLPLTGADLMPKTPVRPEDNAAPLLREAGKTFSKAARPHKGWEQTFALAIAEPTPANMEAAQRVIASLDPALSLAEKAAAKPSIDFGHDWTREDPWKIEFPAFSEIKSLSKGFVFRAQLRAISGDKVGAIRDMRAASRLAEFAGTDPTLMAALVQIATDALVSRTMENIVSRHPGDLDLLNALDEIADRKTNQPMEILRSLRGEIIMSLAAAEAPATDLMDSYFGEVDPEDPNAVSEANKLKAELAPSGVPDDLRARAFRARALQPWIEVYADQATVKDNATLVKRLAEIDYQLKSDDDPTTALRVMTYPMSLQAGHAFLTRDARWQAVRGLMAVLRFKGAQGRYPATLAEAGFTDVDPFTGKAFHLKVEGETVRVYSVGPDGVDNGGEERVNTAPDAPRQMDIVSMFPRRVNAPPK
ncbi:MAG: hypothetical protein ACK5XS_00015 [Armatimonadota bacterium]|jgi:hypothetical protein|nr:hypothetical protein [Fimbriimonadaceae bacterium]